LIAARYSLIRYIPDAARGEELNVGILGWTDNHVLVDVDDRALDRVIRENPHLAKDALVELRDRLRAEIGALNPEDAADDWLANRPGYPIVATESRHTTVSEDTRQALQVTVDRLLQRVVRPRRRSGGRTSPQQALERRMQPLLASKKVVRDHGFSGHRSGITRRVDYFANSTANVALDFVQLSLVSADDIVRRADAEAFKLEDILGSAKITPIVFCSFSSEDAVREATENAERIIESVGAHVVRSVDEATEQMTAAIARSDLAVG
jgi:Protein of unknown function (DUF3037)